MFNTELVAGMTYKDALMLGVLVFIAWKVK